MKLGSTYDEEDYEEPITVGRRRHEKKLDQAWSEKDKSKRKTISNPESSSQRGDRNKPYDIERNTTRFSDTSKSKEKDETKRMHLNKEEALKGIPVSLQE
jgi:hypothetical protein